MLKANDDFTICLKQNYLITLLKYYVCLFLLFLFTHPDREIQLNLLKQLYQFSDIYVDITTYEI
jgi:hypothetical protein